MGECKTKNSVKNYPNLLFQNYFYFFGVLAKDVQRKNQMKVQFSSSATHTKSVLINPYYYLV